MGDVLAKWKPTPANPVCSCSGGTKCCPCETTAEIERLRAALVTIRDTFANDIAQGYSTRDKIFACEIAGAALNNEQSATETGK